MAANGKVVGVVTAKLRGAEALNFAVPINYVRGLLATPSKTMDLPSLQRVLAASASGTDVFKDVSAFPSRWKSLMSGARFTIRRDKDTVYVEWVISAGDAEYGTFFAAELKKDGVGYKGVQRGIYSCQYEVNWGTQAVQNRCPRERQIEFQTFTESRIEGRLWMPPRNTKFNCKKCQYEKPAAWHSFVWIPE